MKQLVLASDNDGKIREIRRVLAPLEIEVLPQSHFKVPGADEPHVTFVENALAKARHASILTGLPAVADGFGTCAPDGQPQQRPWRMEAQPAVPPPDNRVEGHVPGDAHDDHCQQHRARSRDIGSAVCSVKTLQNRPDLQANKDERS